MRRFEEIYRESETMVKRFLLRLCGNEHLAEELTQETFYRALRHWQSFRGQSSPETWLCAIAKRLWLNSLRHPPPLPLQEEMPSEKDNPVEALLDSDRRMAAYRLLHRLPEPYREVFTLRTFGELSHQEVGSLFGKSDAWARVTYYRARQMLNHMAREEMDNER